MFEKRWENPNKIKKCSPIFVDLSNAFDSPPHHLVCPRLNAKGFNYKSIQLLSSLLSNGKKQI